MRNIDQLRAEPGLQEVPQSALSAVLCLAPQPSPGYLQSGYSLETQVGPSHSSPVPVTSTEEVKQSLFGEQGLRVAVSPPDPRLYPEMRDQPLPQEAAVLFKVCPARGLSYSVMGICPPLLLRWWYLGILFDTVSVHLTWLARESLRPLPQDGGPSRLSQVWTQQMSQGKTHCAP